MVYAIPTLFDIALTDYIYYNRYVRNMYLIVFISPCWKLTLVLLRGYAITLRMCDLKAKRCFDVRLYDLFDSIWMLMLRVRSAQSPMVRFPVEIFWSVHKSTTNINQHSSILRNSLD